MHFIKYHTKLIFRAASVTWNQFKPSWGAAMRGVLVTALLWLLLLFSDADKFSDKLSEAALFAVAVVFAFPVVFVFNWFCAPALVDRDQIDRIDAAEKRLATIKSRHEVQGWLIGVANCLTEITRKLESSEVTAKEYLTEFDAAWQPLLEKLGAASAPPSVSYALQNASRHSTLAPTNEMFISKTAQKVLDANEDEADEVARRYTFRDNLDKVIAQQGNGND